MLAILQSLRMQTARLRFSVVTSDSGRFGSAFVLCLSWDGLKELWLSKGSAFRKSGMFSSLLIWRLKNEGAKNNYMSCSPGWNLFL